jgi:hypothetical protein
MDQEILNKFLIEMGDLLKAAKDFTLEQIPQVAREVLKYNAVVCVIWIVVGFVAMSLSHRFARWVRQLVEDNDDYTPMYFIVIIFFAISLAFILPNLIELAKIEFAPRLYLIEYLASLVKHPSCK